MNPLYLPGLWYELDGRHGGRIRRCYALPDWRPQGGTFPGSWRTPNARPWEQSTIATAHRAAAKRLRRAARYRRELRPAP